MKKHALKGTFWWETFHYATFGNIVNNSIRDIQYKYNHHAIVRDISKKWHNAWFPTKLSFLKHVFAWS